ncbi:hypothetical protein QR685DRAFT_448430, partial [Neurospora intermedia]
IIRLTSNKASGSNWPDVSAKTATRIRTALVDSDHGNIAPGSSKVFSSCFRY